MRKNTIVIAVTAFLAVGAGAVPAQAGSRFGCVYPRVCFYQTSTDWLARKPTASYRDMTSEFQRLGSRAEGSYAVYNSRIDDSAWLKMSDDSRSCLGPNDNWFYDQGDTPERVMGIQIVDEDECY